MIWFLFYTAIAGVLFACLVYHLATHTDLGKDLSELYFNDDNRRKSPEEKS